MSAPRHRASALPEDAQSPAQLLAGNGPSGRGRGWLLPVPIALVGERQVWRFEAATLESLRNQKGIERAARHQGALRRPRGASGLHHLLEAVEQIGKVHEGPRLLCPEKCGSRA